MYKILYIWYTHFFNFVHSMYTNFQSTYIIQYIQRTQSLYNVKNCVYSMYTILYIQYT